MARTVEDVDPRLQRAVAEVERYYGDRLIATALFGSRIGCRSRADSDWDLLLVLEPAEPLRRSLYREWDDEVAPRVDGVLRGISPHFVHLLKDRVEPSSLWLEIAMGHRILGDRTGLLAAELTRVHALIEAGRFERRSAHGLPYWRSAP